MNSAAAHRVESSQGQSGTRSPARKAAIAAALFASLILLVSFVLPASAAVNPTYIGSFGPDGTEATEFEAPGSVAVDQETGAVYVIDGAKEVLYKFDASGTPLAYGGSAAYLVGNELTGLEATDGGGTNQVAVDSDSHVVYVTSNNRIRAFEADGEPHIFTEGPGAGTSEIPGASELLGVAVDRYGDIYASDSGDRKIRIYTSSGMLLNEITPEQAESFVVMQPANLSVSPSGTIYVVRRNEAVSRIDPSQFPITPTTTFSLATRLDNIHAYTVAVDPSTSYVYIGQEVASGGGTSRVAIYSATNQLIGTLGGPGQPGQFTEAPVGVAVSGTAQRVYAADLIEALQGAQQVEIFDSLTFPVEAPTITATSATDLTASTATLHARVNPNTLATTYSFEYGTEDCAAHPGACSSVPAGGAAIGSGHEPVPVSVDLAGLSADTVYYYRVVATNSEGTRAGALRTFRTPANALGFEAMDGRVWEQVTPVDKHGGALNNSGYIQAAEDGSGIAFQTNGSILAAPDGNRALELSTVLARREAADWSDADLVPPHSEATGGGSSEYKLFSKDLGSAVMEPRDETLLSPESSGWSSYLRINSNPPVYRPLATHKEGYANVPPEAQFENHFNFDKSPLAVLAANDALTQIVVQSEPPLEPGAQERALYLWSAGTFQAVSELPADEGGGIVRAQPGSGTISVHHAVSSDGSRVFWAPGDPLTTYLEWPALYVRDIVRDESFRLDVPQAGASEAGNRHPAFMGASSDGSVVFFTDPQQLTADASEEGRDLYRCEVGKVASGLGCTKLEDLSASLYGPDKPVSVKEVSLGMSENGDTVYFAAEETAEEGNRSVAPSLYVWQKGKSTHLIARLSKVDAADWGAGQGRIGHGAQAAASASPNGRYLAFMSERALAGAETADPDTGEPVEQAYIYDAATGDLACISCNPSGATDRGQLLTGTEHGTIIEDPLGLWGGHSVGATLPEGTELETTNGFSLYRPREVLDDGRAFFNSPSSLVSADSNGTWDVYQYEPFGTGSCNAAARRPSIAVVGGACIGLISAGNGDHPSFFMDASASGDDAFFATSDRLSVLDGDSEVDVYDARVGGVAAVAEQHPECLGEACQPAPSPPNDPTPASAAFQGPGNPKAAPHKRCARGKRLVHHKGKTRCVKRRHGKHHAHRRAGR